MLNYTDFDASAAFDRVLAGLSIATCERVGLPRIAGLFMYNLLHNMKFHLITGFGQSSSFYINDTDGITGQGVLQGSSFAAPIFLLNSDVSLTASKKLGTGATFKHPITKAEVCEHAVQFVDDTSQYTNKGGIAQLEKETEPISDDTLVKHAQKTSQIWADMLWVSGGNLNLDKCYY
jgi:hypothetical protein